MSFGIPSSPVLKSLKGEHLLLLAIWAIVTAYNIFKPYHIDDTAHLEIARWIIAHPLRPMSGLLNWDGTEQPIFNTNQPHLYFYSLALWGRLFGFSEPAMHALQAIPALACVLLFHRLARAYANSAAIWLTVLLMFGPALIVEQNLMVDVPLLAVWLVFFNALIGDIDSDNQTKRYVIAAIACSAAILIKYSSLVLLVILVISLLYERRRRQAWTVLIPIAVVGLWSAFNYLDYGAVHIVHRPVGGGGTPFMPLRLMMAWVIALGALTPLGIVALAIQFPRQARLVTLAPSIIVVSLAILVASGAVPEEPANALLLIGFLLNSVVMWLTVGSHALRWMRQASLLQFDPNAAPTLYLMLWIVGTSLFYVMFAPFIAARHVLLIMPALLLIFAIAFADRWDARARRFALSTTMILSMALCCSDWRFAAFYKSEAEDLARSLPPANTIWTSGHWGWQWYASQVGFQQVDVKSSKLTPGDLLIIARDVDRQPLLMPLSLELIRSDTERYPLLRLFCTGKTARFYASSMTEAPWSLSRDCIGHINVYRVMATEELRSDAGPL